MNRRTVFGAALAAAIALAAAGCEVSGPAADGARDGWTGTTDPDTGRTFRCYWWQPAGGGGGTLWCYEPDAGPR